MQPRLPGRSAGTQVRPAMGFDVPPYSPAEDPRTSAEEPGMCVTPEVFAMRLAQLRRYFTPMRLADWVAKQRAGEPLPARACAVTFDDGWRDNIEYALPCWNRPRYLPLSLPWRENRHSTFSSGPTW